MNKIVNSIQEVQKSINDILENLIDTVISNSTNKVISNKKQNQSSPNNSYEKQAIIEAIMGGTDTKTLVNLYPHYTTQQIAAIRAHVTMGTYSTR
ncbi:hypothetical protein CL621_01105 [archaeon]|nr:hypothetical protein [archaeon]|tara:strand:- start:3209 stop:3493 length:285 start_codon:yes stop_codon:yes gene_type:complete